jgi:hypothetical protein
VGGVVVAPPANRFPSSVLQNTFFISLLLFFLLYDAGMSLINQSLKRKGTLVGIMVWSAHYHGGQWSREYRMGCRARRLLERGNEIGGYLASKWFDLFEEHLKTGTVRIIFNREMADAASAVYHKLAKYSEEEAF